jgi:uncharacterized protein (TIGR02996 family)
MARGVFCGLDFGGEDGVPSVEDMTDRDALLRAICDAPDDDAPRLIYADWLDEHGDPRQAEFIRVQIELAQVPEPERESHPLAARQMELWRDLRKWRFHTGNWLSFNSSCFHRGFSERWLGEATEFVRTDDQWWKFGPIRTLRLLITTAKSAAIEVADAAMPRAILGRIFELELMGEKLHDEWVEHFLRSPHWSVWTSLALDGDHLTDLVCTNLAASPLVSSRCCVHIESRALTDNGRQIMRRAFGPNYSLARLR